mmetsp:Transcript_14260/g.34777  ORF Transcript_14260/g.34777 Transcript_14260/m.34777 type:complete len:182 (-) Transcript_14260:157-702(-)|eukprot:CAMPEP_0114537796 /NCGR_PEP_ID=MMETSP0109-20121206/29772_1 /TAXON_ID=29199 /ORGANISM="Chlorarachnion reptans, Strain CCCM449" /LENGTH=181 /DNA_ID=CAMNT_0001721715 /DNA_START=349 /DNA_END=894 /DNA_ORIENTATION=+
MANKKRTWERKGKSKKEGQKRDNAERVQGNRKSTDGQMSSDNTRDIACVTAVKSKAEGRKLQKLRRRDLIADGELKKANATLWFMAEAWWSEVTRQEAKRIEVWEVKAATHRDEVERGFEVDPIEPRPITPVLLSAARLAANDVAVRGISDRWTEIAEVHCMSFDDDDHDEYAILAAGEEV